MAITSICNHLLPLTNLHCLDPQQAPPPAVVLDLMGFLLCVVNSSSQVSHQLLAQQLQELPQEFPIHMRSLIMEYLVVSFSHLLILKQEEHLGPGSSVLTYCSVESLSLL